MKQMRLKDLCVGQLFTMSRGVSRFTRVYKVFSRNDKATLVFCNNGKVYSFKNDIVIYLKVINSLDVPFSMTDEFVIYLNNNNHLVLRVNYGHTLTTDEVMYI